MTRKPPRIRVRVGAAAWLRLLIQSTVLCAGGVVIAASAAAQQGVSACEPLPVDKPVAVVTLLKGQWQLSIGTTSMPLCGAQQLPAGARLEPVSERASLHIASSEERGVTYSVSGNRLGPTAITIDPTETRVLKFPERVLLAVRLLFSLRDVYTPPRSRSRGVPLEDAVLELGLGGRLDLQQVFRPDSAVDYEFVLEEWVGSPQGSGWRRLQMLSYRWRPDSPTVSEIAGLQPGLYRIQLLNHGVATLDDAWLLLSSSDTFPEWSQDFQSFQEQKPWWGGSSESVETRGLRRAYLHLLAQEGVAARAK